MKNVGYLLIAACLVVGCGSSGGVSDTQEKALHAKLAGPPNARNRGARNHRRPPGQAATGTPPITPAASN